MERIELEQNAAVAIDDEHVPVTVRVRIVSREAAFDPFLLRLRFLRNWITGRKARRAVVALVVVIECHGNERLRGHDDPRYPIDRRIGISAVSAEVRMHSAGAADGVDERAAVRVDGRIRDVRVPPVRRREKRQRTGKLSTSDRCLRRKAKGPYGQERKQSDATHEPYCERGLKDRRAPDHCKSVASD